MEQINEQSPEAHATNEGEVELTAEELAAEEKKEKEEEVLTLQLFKWG